MRGFPHRRKPDAKHFIKIGGRISADQQYALAVIREANRRCTGERGFANAALAGEEQKEGWLINEFHRCASCIGSRVAAAQQHLDAIDTVLSVAGPQHPLWDCALLVVTTLMAANDAFLSR